MKVDTSLSIAYIAGRLIYGKPIASLYDYSRARYIDIACLPHPEHLMRFDHARPVNAFGFTSDSKYRYPFDHGNYIDLTSNGGRFIGYVSERSSHFTGRVREDSSYLYDGDESVHFNCRISGCVGEYENGSCLCDPCRPARRVVVNYE